MLRMIEGLDGYGSVNTNIMQGFRGMKVPNALVLQLTCR